MVPEGWQEKYLKDILSGSIRNGFSPVAADKETGFWVLSLGSLGDEGINATEVKPVEPTDRVLQTQLSKGDFLVSRSNTPNKVGRSIRFHGEVENCSYPDLMMRFRIDVKKADPTFIEHKLKSANVRSYLRNCAAGSSATMVKINKGALENTLLLLPGLPEQKKIAQILSTWDKAIATTEQLLANSQQQKKALMHLLFNGNKRFPGHVGTWESNLLGEIIRFTKGVQINKNTLSAFGEYPVINGGITPSGYTVDFNTTGNTITISEGGNSCGHVAFQNNNFWCGGHCYAIKETKLNLDFTYQILKANERKIMGLRVGSGLPNIQKKALESFALSYPLDESEQKKISSVLSVSDKEIAVLKQKLSHLKQEKKALMQQLLTGKRRVKMEVV